MMKLSVSAPRTVNGKFLLVFFPLACILVLVLFTFFEWRVNQSERQALQQKLDQILDLQRVILAGPVANQDRQQVQSILAALSSDPNLANAELGSGHGPHPRPAPEPDTEAEAPEDGRARHGRS